METKTKINIPPLSVQKDEITILGEKDGVAIAKDKILRIYKEKVNIPSLCVYIALIKLQLKWISLTYWV